MLLITCTVLAVCTQTSFGIWNDRWDLNGQAGRGQLDYKTKNGHTFGAHGTLNNGLGLGLQGTLKGNNWSAGGHATHNLNTGRTNFGAQGSINFGKNWSGSAHINHGTHGGGTYGGFRFTKTFGKRSLACLLRCERDCRGSTKECFKECLTKC